MKPRGERIACMIETDDGARGVFSVLAGAEPNSVERVDPVEWGGDKPRGDVKLAMFSLVGEMGMTGQIVRITGEEWAALMHANALHGFYSTILWGGGPLKIVQAAVAVRKKSIAA